VIRGSADRFMVLFGCVRAAEHLRCARFYGSGWEGFWGLFNHGPLNGPTPDVDITSTKNATEKGLRSQRPTIAHADCGALLASLPEP